MNGVRKACPKLSLQCKNEHKNSEHLHLWYTLRLFSLSVTMREADGNYLNCAYLYYSQILSYCVKHMKHCMLCALLQA